MDHVACKGIPTALIVVPCWGTTMGTLRNLVKVTGLTLDPHIHHAKPHLFRGPMHSAPPPLTVCPRALHGPCLIV